MIEEGYGDLLAADVDGLVNAVNTVGVMGKGLALQFKRAFTAGFRAYQAACRRGEVRLGRVWTYDTGEAGPRRYLIHVPTKGHWRSASRLPDVAAGLDSLVGEVARLRISSIAVPALGCGNGGLAWDDVRPLVEQAGRRMGAVRCVVYAPAP